MAAVYWCHWSFLKFSQLSSLQNDSSTGLSLWEYDSIKHILNASLSSFSLVNFPFMGFLCCALNSFSYCFQWFITTMYYGFWLYESVSGLMTLSGLAHASAVSFLGSRNRTESTELTAICCPSTTSIQQVSSVNLPWWRQGHNRTSRNTNTGYSQWMLSFEVSCLEKMLISGIL